LTISVRRGMCAVPMPMGCGAARTPRLAGALEAAAAQDSSWAQQAAAQAAGTKDADPLLAALEELDAKPLQGSSASAAAAAEEAAVETALAELAAQGELARLPGVDKLLKACRKYREQLPRFPELQAERGRLLALALQRECTEQRCCCCCCCWASQCQKGRRRHRRTKALGGMGWA
jgi:hypothetical protein